MHFQMSEHGHVTWKPYIIELDTHCVLGSCLKFTYQSISPQMYKLYLTSIIVYHDIDTYVHLFAESNIYPRISASLGNMG